MSRSWLATMLDRAGRGARTKLAKHMGVRPDAITRMLTEEPGKESRDISAADLMKMAEFFGEPPPMPNGHHQTMIPIVGLAGAGPDGTVLFATGDGNFGEVPAPVNATESTVALEVRGTSMRGIAEDGWIVTYDDSDKAAPSPEIYGEPCICWLEDDRVLIKYLWPGRGAGLFDLESANAPTMRDVPVRFAALVASIVPRKPAQRFIKRRPDHEFEDVEVR